MAALASILFSDWKDYIYFGSTSHPDTSYQVSNQLVQEKKFTTDFQHGGYDDNLAFPEGF